MKIAVVADSNSGITQEEGKRLGIYVLPMPFIIDGETYEEDVTLTQEQFYEKQASGADISTSQPSPESVMDLWNRLLEQEGYDQIVHIPMSSGLSGSCQTARMLAEDYDGRVQVVDNQRISVTQRQSAIDARDLAASGFDAAQIREILERMALESSIYVMVDTLKYLKRRAHHPGCRGAGDAFEDQAGAPDPGREAGHLFQSADGQAGEEHHAGGGGPRPGGAIPRPGGGAHLAGRGTGLQPGGSGGVRGREPGTVPKDRRDLPGFDLAEHLHSHRTEHPGGWMYKEAGYRGGKGTLWNLKKKKAGSADGTGA